MKRFVRGDIDGFFALGLDNLLMLILMSSLCLGVLSFSPELFFARILPATAIGLIVGNLFYARAALKLARRENRTDVCAIPYGVNLLTVIVYVYQVMLPAQTQALGSGLSKEEADIVAWHAGLVACLGSGLIEFLGAFFIDFIRRFTPRAALLAALAAIGIFFIGMDFVFRAWANPLVGMTTLAITMVVYFGRVTFVGKIPAGFVVLVLGTVLAWIIQVAPVGELRTEQIGLHFPLPVIGDLVESVQYMLPYMAVIVPMGFINLVLSLQNIESAAAAGDSYPARPALAFNGLGTLGASIFGSPFPTAIYIGHPGWKAIGARAGYSTLNAIVMTLICFTGVLSVVTYVIPLEAGMAILIWIGIMMGTQAFQATPSNHTPAVVVGLMPGIAAFSALISKHMLAVAGAIGGQSFFSEGTVEALVEIRTFFADGMFALEQGYVYTSIVLASATVAIIERKFRVGAAWLFSGAVLSTMGFIHSYQMTPFDVIGSFEINFTAWPWISLDMSKWTWGYLAMSGILLLMPYVTKPDDDEGPL
ncbi:MAG: NCS2 family permease [Verrucomicrobiota bacterium]